jgi:hypothetical protein
MRSLSRRIAVLAGQDKKKQTETTTTIKIKEAGDPI